MYELLGISLSLAGLLIINSAVSLSAAALWTRLCGPSRSWPVAARAQVLFLLRLAPGLTAVSMVGILFIPAYLANEPRHTTEVVTAKLGLLAAASLYGIGMAIWHGIARSVATRRLVREWLRRAERIRIRQLSIPAYRFPHSFPVIALVGALRPRLFVADQIFASLTEAEFAAALAHEQGHLAMLDNYKRGMLRSCRDLLASIPICRSLDRAWTESAEWAADEYAARGGGAAALDLASALVKVARLVPEGSTPALPAAASLVVEDPGGITARVRRLVELAGSPGPAGRRTHRTVTLAACACASCFCIALVLSACSPQLLETLHRTLEHVVSALQ